ncbi:hypothetical protein F4861DRAFT_410364 [Xylaria intraflava]|nr:hypothetical protein F4861DRAFT_410364 [Xylaria intraflava]
MKVLITGGSGRIGGGCLKQCLSHPKISTVVAFGRSSLAGEVANHPKLKQVIVKDFAKWPEDVLDAHADAAGMIWAMGSRNGRSRTADFEYALTFLDSMGRVLESKPKRPLFKYIQLSGRFVRSDQDMKLWWGDYPRKLKGLCDTKVLEFGNSHKDSWKTSVVKPGPVGSEVVMGHRLFIAMLGTNVGILDNELGAFMTYLLVDGEGESEVTENLRMVTKGREILQAQRHAH